MQAKKSICRLAVKLVNNMKVEGVCEGNDLKDLIQIELLSYKEAVEIL